MEPKRSRFTRWLVRGIVGTRRDSLRLRAGVWYRQAAPKLAGGLMGQKVKQRLEELAKAGLSSRLDEIAGTNIRGR